MRTFTQKQNQPKQRTSFNIARSSTVSPAASHEVHPIQQSQRTIGNQAEQRLLRMNAEDLETASGVTAANPFVHNFSRIPVYAKAPVKIRKILTVNDSGDIYEQEADRVAGQVMRMPDPNLSITAPPPRLSRKCAACEEEEGEKLQTKRAETPEAAGKAPGIVHEVLRSPGQPLPLPSVPSSNHVLGMTFLGYGCTRMSKVPHRPRR